MSQLVGHGTVVFGKCSSINRTFPMTFAHYVRFAFFSDFVVIERGKVDFDIFVMFWIIFVVLGVRHFVFILIQFFGCIFGFLCFHIVDRYMFPSHYSKYHFGRSNFRQLDLKLICFLFLASGQHCGFMRQFT